MERTKRAVIAVKRFADSVEPMHRGPRCNDETFQRDWKRAVVGRLRIRRIRAPRVDTPEFKNESPTGC